MSTMPLWVIALAALSGFIVGGIWYGPLFGKVWQRETGLSDAEVAAINPLKVYGLAFLFSLLSAVFLGHMFAMATPTPRGMMMISTGIALGFIIPALGTNYLFARKSGKLFAIDAGYWLVFYAVMGLVFMLLG